MRKNNSRLPWINRLRRKVRKVVSNNSQPNRLKAILRFIGFKLTRRFQMKIQQKATVLKLKKYD